MFSAQEIEILRRWERVAPRFHRQYSSDIFSFKDVAFREVYGELIRQIVQNFVPRKPLVLKTDLWNEGVEVGRNLASTVRQAASNVTLVGSDISRYICESVPDTTRNYVQIMRSTLLAPPYRQVFDLVVDVSTVDHMPERLREIWISAAASILKENGILLISFDCRLNLFTELFHKFFTRKHYPEWTLLPSHVRLQLQRHGLHVIREHALFIPGIFLGTHRPWFPLAVTLDQRRVFDFLKKVELSRKSTHFSFIAPQYVIVAKKIGNLNKKSSRIT